MCLLAYRLKELAVLVDQHIRKAAQKDPLGLSFLRLDERSENCMSGETRGKEEFIIYPLVEKRHTSNLPGKIFIFR